MVRERTSFRDFSDRYILKPGTPAFEAELASVFSSPREVEADLGCGRGRFLLARARQFPERVFVGLERVVLRLRKLDSRALKEGITNIRLIQTEALMAVKDILPPSSISTFYLYFPDPWPKRRHHGRRLVSATFVEAVYKCLRPQGIIHICTDHADYFAAIERLWRQDTRFQECPPYIPGDDEETDFGLIFRRKGLTPFRCSFRKHPTG